MATHFDLFMSHLRVSRLDEETATKLITAFKTLLNLTALFEGEDESTLRIAASNSIMCHTQNPFKVGVMIIDASEKIAELYPVIKYKTKLLRDNIVKVLESLINKIDSLGKL